jgi:2-oxoglutarate ferredoxin oxidoreductase subunit alpha
VPRYEDLAPIAVAHPTDPEGFHPYSRDEATLARPWAIPGTPGLEHRIGGLEKENVTGNVSYSPTNHELMCRLRADKLRRIADFIPDLQATGPAEGDLLVLSWGGSYGAAVSAVRSRVERGRSVAHAHLRHIHPFPRNLGSLLSRYRRVLIPELNSGQLSFLVRARYLVDTLSYPKIQGQPFTITEIEQKIEELLA